MIFNSTEKEFISAIITYEGKAKSLAEVLNKASCWRRRGLASCNMKERILFF